MPRAPVSEELLTPDQRSVHETFLSVDRHSCWLLGYSSVCILYTHSFSQYTIPLYTVCTVYHASRFQVPSPRNIGHACCKIYTLTFVLLLFVAVSVQLLWGWGGGDGGLESGV